MIHTPNDGPEIVEIKQQGPYNEATKTYEYSWPTPLPVLGRIVHFTESTQSRDNGPEWRETMAVVCHIRTGEYREYPLWLIRQHKEAQ